MSDTTELIKEKIDIADFVRPYVSLFPAGKNLKGLCPFHKEKTPSFFVSPERQTWHCFGCNQGGDVISFLMKYENLEFFEALKVLAEKAGIDLRRFGGQDQRHFAVLYEINTAAKDFFKNALRSDFVSAAQAREYLLGRGLAASTIEEFELGFAPNSSDALSRYLMKLGFAVSDIERAGFVVKTERGTYWDRFRNRIMFPLANAFGKVVGFTGRIMPGAEAEGVGKYVNSPDSPAFNKSKLLYGFDKSKHFIRETKTAVLVEGQMDFLMTWQDGVKNLVATSGTALTAEHLLGLRRAADTLIVGFDADEAGLSATERVIDLASSQDFSVKVLDRRAAPAGAKDPADIVRSAPGLMTTLVASAYPAMQYYFDRYLAASSDVASRKRSLRTVLIKIKGIASPIEQAYWVKALSERSAIREAELFDELQVLPKASTVKVHSPAAQEEDSSPRSRYERIAGRIVGLAMLHPAIHDSVAECLQYFPTDHQELFTRAVLKQAPCEDDLAAAAVKLSMEASMISEAGVRDPLSEARDLLRELKVEYFRREREKFASKVAEAEAKGDAAALEAALKDFDRVSRSMNNG